MQIHPDKFPHDRRVDPMRQAEARVFDEIRGSHQPGFAYYEWQRDHNSPQIDVALWLSGVGRFGLEIKGGRYSFERGKWCLETETGLQKKKCPLRKTWDATMSLRDELAGILDYPVFLIAVVVFPDMEPDQAIIARAKRTNVHVLWGADGLVDRLEQIAAARGVYNPPDAGDIEREVAAVTDEQVLYEPEVDRPLRRRQNPPSHQVPPESRTTVTAGSITIQRVDVLNVYTVSGWNPDAGEDLHVDMLADTERPTEE